MKIRQLFELNEKLDESGSSENGFAILMLVFLAIVVLSWLAPGWVNDLISLLGGL